MSRLDETKAAIVERLQALKAAPQYVIDLYGIGVPLSAAGFTPDELYVALTSLEQDGVIELIRGNRLLVTNPVSLWTDRDGMRLRWLRGERRSHLVWPAASAAELSRTADAWCKHEGIAGRAAD